MTLLDLCKKYLLREVMPTTGEFEDGCNYALLKTKQTLGKIKLDEENLMNLLIAKAMVEGGYFGEDWHKKYAQIVQSQTQAIIHSLPGMMKIKE